MSSFTYIDLTPPKDPYAPKKPPSSYLLYASSNSIREVTKAEFPTLSGPEISKEIGKKWKALPEGEKKPYKEEAARLRQQYNNTLEEYKRSQQYAAFQQKLAEYEELQQRVRFGHISWSDDNKSSSNSDDHRNNPAQIASISTGNNDSNRYDMPLQRQGQQWTKKETDYLWSNRTSQSMIAIAMYLKRSQSAVRQKLKELEIEDAKHKPTCSVCGKRFEKQRSLDLHVRMSNDEKHEKFRRRNDSKSDTTTSTSTHKPSTSDIVPKTNTKATTVNTGNNTINIHMAVPAAPSSVSESNTMRSSAKKRGRESVDGRKKKRKVDKLKWNKYEVAEWIESFDAKFKVYAHRFLEEEISGELMATLDEEALNEVVDNKLHQKRILMRWRKL